MLLVKIADKLADLYCAKAQKTIDELNVKQYGINCPLSDFAVDGDIQIMLLEYNYQFTEEQLLNSNSIDCVKKIIYE